MQTITSFMCPVNEHLGSIYRVVKSYHYNICNAPFNYHALTLYSHETIMVF
jgi:hypothetical protein